MESVYIILMDRLKTISRACMLVVGVIFLLYLLDRFSASSRVPVDVLTLQDTLMFPLLLLLATFMGVIFMIEAHLGSQEELE